MSPTSPTLPWHPIPRSPSGETCKVHLLQAGGLNIPYELTLLPGPNEPNVSTSLDNNNQKGKHFYAPDYVFLIQHTPTKEQYVFDLGMRTDLENLPPYLVKNTLPVFKCDPIAAADIIRKHGTPEQQPEKAKAVIFSHMHFDHVGDGAKAGFESAELWVGPTCCTYARPGYPVEPNAPVLTENLPPDGSRKIVELFVSDALLERAGDKRVGQVQEAKSKGLYEAVHFRDPGDEGWIGVAAFDRAVDVFGDGSAYLIDAPGHSAGHQMMLVRVKTGGTDDDHFVLLAGDCYHHPELLQDPRSMARPPYSKGSMHLIPEVAIETVYRTRACAQRDNIWVIGAHDFSVGNEICSDRKVIEGLVSLDDWKERGWKNRLV
ncbi:hypothetical protein BU24DRAFT_426820 [Aaosphaeria arxii CBS 175.79]|uniref:Metallo-beta-lactamase domain-containing protein n=1 Tax=Aaosphaeria arxii CBS 175.79 TaxID=1450172 RepID=A0A6A5XF36_9PLEO|nr:uncharacterized protein BU24DRAFT_426820 [Aaosphaeria arxii CBS 175.79]KAF2011728.1 hypothetical protein BU24DRAFT_426820 [Aaosphaeria arxii CBS 175.79]